MANAMNSPTSLQHLKLYIFLIFMQQFFSVQTFIIRKKNLTVVQQILA